MCINKLASRVETGSYRRSVGLDSLSLYETREAYYLMMGCTVGPILTIDVHGTVKIHPRVVPWKTGRIFPRCAAGEAFSSESLSTPRNVAMINGNFAMYCSLTTSTCLFQHRSLTIQRQSSRSVGLLTRGNKKGECPVT
jgi:hypothetical protein